MIDQGQKVYGPLGPVMRRQLSRGEWELIGPSAQVCRILGLGFSACSSLASSMFDDRIQSEVSTVSDRFDTNVSSIDVLCIIRVVECSLVKRREF